MPATALPDHLPRPRRLRDPRPRGSLLRPGAPDRAWVQDITYVPTGEGWLYLASVLDLGSRRLLGYSMADHMRTELVLDALGMAVAAHGGAVAGIIGHADRGSQYTSNDYLEFCQRHQIRPSVGRTGACWDNAVAESFWESLKRECLQGRMFAPTPRPAGRTSAGSTGTTPPGCTPASTASHPSSGNSSTVKRHNHPSARRGDGHRRGGVGGGHVEGCGRHRLGVAARVAASSWR